MAAEAEFKAVMDAARAACRATTVHQRYGCVQRLDVAIKKYDNAVDHAQKHPHDFGELG